ncbi:hypothetical protein NEOLEDRAFT_1244496 [Neolentinus lepideus HHB14362 ss-1]|uniref:F-box domain-containing protein n=1 Tax=Neolentinus lepideus HHB14362 ss-1 TaxID=1314782 RepID=A0A165PW30_9AGAM|nr:hypothetical protein NEOLEDRAFT_1244496 [Neolentinus lepideus HHB14362 ss-1]
MHSALVVDEILRQILEECDDFSDQSTRKTLSRLSRCCKAWKEPALDQLWGRLPRIGPLLSLFSGYAYANGVHRLDREVVPDDLRLFHSYAKRVRRLSWRLSTRLSPSMISALETARKDSGTGSLLPRLISFEGIMSPKGDMSPWSGIISFSLRHVDIHSHWRGARECCDAIADWLTQLLTVARGLESFKFRGYASRRLNELFSSMTTLRSINIRTGSRGNLSGACLASMTSSTNLHSLKLKIRGLGVSTFRAALMDHAAPKFPALQHLHIDASEDNLIDCILDLIPCNTLRSLHVEFEESSSTKSASIILEKLAYKASSALQDLVIIHNAYVDDDDFTLPGTRLWTVNTLRPLASIKTLKNFCLDTLLPPVLKQEDVEEILSWWPRVERIHLATGDEEETEEETEEMETELIVAVQLEAARGVKSLILPKRDANGKPFDVAALSRSRCPTSNSE